MADNVTQNISIALYRYLCQNIVGTEDHVKQLRLINTVRDNLSSDEKMTFITSGSFGEGLEMRGSDLDIMCVLKDMKIHNVKSSSHPNIRHWTMDTDDVKPGFTKLYCENTCGMFHRTLEELNGKYYFSSAIFRQGLLVDKKKLSIHGPCISDNDEKMDIALCLRCKTWVSPATQWITRPSNQWPSLNVKQHIVDHGVLFVPIGVKGSPKEHLEWRISFSVGEKLLINTFTHSQLLCYALLKILLKDVIATNSECKDLLCSYFLKTIIFWISEELPQHAWKPDSLIPCFMQCLRRLIYCVKYSVCLHYFIPENNMFENKIEGRARDILLEKLFNLHSYGWRCILFSDQISKFHGSMVNFHIKPHSLYVSEVVTIINSLQLQSLNILVTHIMKNVFNRGIKLIVSCQKSSIKYLYTYFMSIACSIRAQTLPLTSTCSNKYRYKQYRSCLSTLQQNIYHDAVSGWLMLASFFYKTKQYNKALRIIEYSISKYTPEKLFRSMDVLDIDHRLLKLKTIQKKSIVQQWKIMLVDVMIFEQNSLLIPYELLKEVENDTCSIQTTQYAFSLSFVVIIISITPGNVRIPCKIYDCVEEANYFIENSDADFSAYNLTVVDFGIIVDIKHYRNI